MALIKNRQSTGDLLRILAAQGEMKAQDFLTHVSRVRGDYLDFYPAAALLHGGYINTETEGVAGRMPVQGRLGANTQQTAILLARLALPPGESFQINNVRHDSWNDFQIHIFMTSEGYLRLDELDQRRIERNRKRVDYLVSFCVAVLAAVLSSSLTNYYASKRLQVDRQQVNAPSNPPARSNSDAERTPSIQPTKRGH